MSDLKELLPRGALGSAEAAKIRGRRGFAQTLLLGRMGRAPLQPFSDRQYSARATSPTKLSVGLREVIPWRIANVGASRPRWVMTTPSKPVVVYTDASGAAHLGAILYVGTKMHTVSIHAPEWFMRSSAGIFELDVLADLLGVSLACEVAPGAPHRVSV